MKSRTWPIWLLALLGSSAGLAIGDGVQGRAAAIACFCLVLWLAELVPPFVPTLVLVAGVPLLLGENSPEFGLARTLAGAADPVLALFFGGFVLGQAAERHGIARRMAALAVSFSAGRRVRLLALLMAATAALSMWMSNIAAAAVVLRALRPLWRGKPPSDPFRRALLVGVAMAANFGGMGTPIGSGPNAIALAAASSLHPISFIQWMTFALPLTVAMLGLAFVLVVARYRVHGPVVMPPVPEAAFDRRVHGVVAIFLASVAAWLSEPLHHVPAAVVALLSATVLFGSGLLGARDLLRIDWSTLLLIAGGISLGRLLEKSGLVHAMVGSMDPAAMPAMARVFLIVTVAAAFSALMSNTATASMLIPVAMSLDPAPSTALVIAIGCSLGVPFSISTPPNAMAFGEGGLTTKDLLWPGLLLMAIGCSVVGVTGPGVLSLLGLG